MTLSRFGALVVVLTAPVVMSSAQAQVRPEGLEQRASAYYEAFTASDFSRVWTFFGARMKADTPRDEYVNNARAAFKEVRVTTSPRVISSGRTGESGRPTAKVGTELEFTTFDGRKVRATHTTEWIWQSDAETARDNWYLGREALKEEAPAGTPGVTS